jgi:hypothetical protein
MEPTVRAGLLVAPAQLLKELVGVCLGTEPVGQLRDAHRHTNTVTGLTAFVKHVTVSTMTDLPPNMQAKRAVEDQALALGAERRKIDDQHIANTRAIIALIPHAGEAGVSLDDLASMVQVSRQTLYRWRDVAARLRADTED